MELSIREARKRDALESDYSEAIPELSKFIEEELERLEDSRFVKQGSAPRVDRLSTLFRDTLDAIWVDSA